MEKDKLDQAVQTYIDIVLYTSLILIVGYTFVIAWIYKGSQFKILIMLSAMLLASALMSICADSVANVYVKRDGKAGWLALEAICVYVRDSLFNLAHWIFCFKYWKIAIEMEALIKMKPLSKLAQSFTLVTNWVMITLGVLCPLLYSVPFFVLNQYYPRNVTDPKKPPRALYIVYMIGNYSKGTLLLIAALFLADSIRRIRKIIRQAASSQQQMNHQVMIAHMLVLVLYILSDILYYIAFTVGTVENTDKSQLNLYRTWDACVIMNFLQQVFLIALFYNLGKKNEPNSEDHTETPKEPPLEQLESAEATNTSRMTNVLDGRSNTIVSEDDLDSQPTPNMMPPAYGNAD
jgi:hypothetical protein